MLEVRNIPAERLRAYLIDELAGGRHRDGSIAGDGWGVRFTQLPPAAVGGLRVPALHVVITGVRAEDAAAFLRRKTMRGGG